MRELSGKLNTREQGEGSGEQMPAPERLFEGAEPLVARLRSEAPFASGPAMLLRAREILNALSEADQIAVINAHPRIGENADRVRAQSAASYSEQGYDHDDTPSDALVPCSRRG